MTTSTLIAPRPAAPLPALPQPAPAGDVPVATASAVGRRAVLGLRGPSDISTTVLHSVRLAAA